MRAVPLPARHQGGRGVPSCGAPDQHWRHAARAAATIASAMPVLPEVGSTSVVAPGVISPGRSTAV